MSHDKDGGWLLQRLTKRVTRRERLQQFGYWILTALWIHDNGRRFDVRAEMKTLEPPRESTNIPAVRDLSSVSHLELLGSLIKHRLRTVRITKESCDSIMVAGKVRLCTERLATQQWHMI